MPTTYAQHVAAARAAQAAALDEVKAATENLKAVLDAKSAELDEGDGPRSPAKAFIENFNSMITGQLQGPLGDLIASFTPPVPTPSE